MLFDLRFEPFVTDDRCFYVFCDDNLVAVVKKVRDGWQPMGHANNSKSTVFKTPLMAAFADANLSGKEFWETVS